MIKLGMRKQILVLLLLALGFVLRMNNLSQRSLWTDEFFTFFLATGHGVDIENLLHSFSSAPEPKLLKAKEFKIFLRNDPAKHIQDVNKGLFYTDTHPPLYFWIMHFWMRIFKDNALSARSFSVLLGVISIFLAYRLGRILFEENVAIFCALLVSTTAFCVRYSQEARAYALIMALGLSSSIFILRFERHRKNWESLIWAILNCIGIYTHYFYIFISLAQFTYFTIIYYKDSAILRRFYLCFIFSFLLFSPWFMPVILKGYNFNRAEWIFGYPGLVNKIYYFLSGSSRYLFLFDVSSILNRLLLLLGLLLFGYMLFLTWKDLTTQYRRQFLYCLILFLMPILSMLFIDIVQKGALLKQERFWMFSLLGFIPFAGYILNCSFSKNRTIVYIFIVLILISSLMSSGLEFGPSPERTSRWIKEESGKGKSCVIIYNIRSAVLSQAYYLDDDIYLMPVSNEKQLNNALELCSLSVDRVFIAHHYHRTDTSLMDELFMDIDNTEVAGFKFKTVVKMDDVGVFEYVRADL